MGIADAAAQPDDDSNVPVAVKQEFEGMCWRTRMISYPFSLDFHVVLLRGSCRIEIQCGFVVGAIGHGPRGRNGFLEVSSCAVLPEDPAPSSWLSECPASVTLPLPTPPLSWTCTNACMRS